MSLELGYNPIIITMFFSSIGGGGFESKYVIVDINNRKKNVSHLFMPNIGGTIAPLVWIELTDLPNSGLPSSYTSEFLKTIISMLYTNFENPRIGSKGLFDNNEEKK